MVFFKQEALKFFLHRLNERLIDGEKTTLYENIQSRQNEKSPTISMLHFILLVESKKIKFTNIMKQNMKI